jgi:hemin uptake protein HemP
LTLSLNKIRCCSGEASIEDMTMSEPNEREKDSRENPEPSLSARIIPAEEIFGDQREVLIELDGERYRLRITRRGRLILQK